MKRRHFFRITAAAILPAALLMLGPGGIAQEEPSFSIEKVGGRVSCLYGAGGNIGILEGERGLLIVDAQYARSADAALTKIREVSDRPILYLINTHYHGDHTDGNSVLGKGAEIIASVPCRDSHLRGLQPEETPESKGVPSKTFERDMLLELDGETVRLLHFGPGHTAGDTVVIFEKSKVIHAGDLFFNGVPPYIDVQDGSDTANWIKTIGRLAERYPDFRVIPGHGPVTDMPGWMRLAEYLTYLRGQVTAAIEAGQTREQAVESIDLAKFEHFQDRGEFLTKKKNIEWIYDEMTRK